MPPLVSLAAALAALLAAATTVAATPQSLPNPLPVRVSVADDGVQADAMCIAPKLSGNGRYVVFSSAATTLAAVDDSGYPHVYVHDQATHQTRLVDLASDGTLANGGSVHAAISDDGRFVAFRSTATNLIAGGSAPGPSHVYLRDLVDNRTTMVNESVVGTTLRESPHANIDLSGDGGAVASSAVDARGVAGVFVFDRTVGRTSRVSQSSAGIAADDQAWAPSLSRDGRFAAFASRATNLVANDTNNDWDVFVHDRVTGETTRVSLAPDGRQNGGSAPHLAADGRFVTFTSPPAMAAFVHDRASGATTLVSRSPDGQPVAAWNPRVSADGRMVVFGTRVGLVPSDTNAAPDYYVYDRVFDTVRLLSVGLAPSAGAETASQTMALSADGRMAAFDSPQTDLVADDTNGVVDVFTRSLDSDGDGVMDDWEFAFGLDPSNPTDAGLDLDGDGLTMAAEARAGSHPRGLTTQYFAEGVTGPFFATTLALSNEGPVPAQVLLRFQRVDGLPVEHGLTVAPGATRSVDLASIPGLASAEFSTVVESNVPVTIERRVSWSGLGTHGEAGVRQPALIWYFAEGATLWGFDLFYLLQNPGALPADVEITYFFAGPREPLVTRHTVPAASRLTIWVNQEDARLRHAEIGAVLRSTNGVPIVAERAMYLSTPDATFAAGHVGAGATAPATRWYVAEGATGTYFDTFLLIANPETEDADVSLQFLLPDGSTLTRVRRVAAGHRETVWVDVEHRALANTAFSVIATSTNAVPVVLERVMWWPGPTAATWHGAHVSPAITSPAARWTFAIPSSEGGDTADSYLLIANTDDQPRTANLRLHLSSGREVRQSFVLPATSRTTVSLDLEFPDVRNDPCVDIVVESYDALGALVVERATYERRPDRSWSDGASLRGTPLASVFETEQAFSAAMPSTTVAAFSLLPPGLNAQCGISCPVVLRVGDVDVELTSAGQAFVDDAPPLFQTGTSALVTTVLDSANNIVIVPPAGTTGLGIRAAAPAGVTVTVIDGEQGATTVWFDAAPGFVGFHSAAGIRSLRVSAPVGSGPTPTVGLEAIVYSR